MHRRILVKRKGKKAEKKTGISGFQGIKHSLFLKSLRERDRERSSA